MKFIDVLLLSLMAVFVFIGLYETILFGIGTGYWALMLAIFLFFIYTYRKRASK
jgi:hypothetical protein